MSDDEGVTPLQAALEAAPARVTPALGKGALGTRWPRQSVGNQTLNWVLLGLRRGEGAMQTPPRRGWGKARPEKWRAEPRPEPDSGNPTVRDRRGALRNVTSWQVHAVRALKIYPDPRALDAHARICAGGAG